jgi:SAM-dependent methyltransferase
MESSESSEPDKRHGDDAEPGHREVHFSDFDTRRYRTVDVPTGYGEWVATYEQTVEDAMDIALLDGLSAVPWRTIDRAADLGCGTGRTGAWLRSKGVTSVDGVDLTPEMLAVARSRGIYDRLGEADVVATGLPTDSYALVIASLVDEHLRDLRPLYHEAHRLARPGGFFVLVAYHPHFIMTAGMPTHFTGESGEPVAIETHLHLLSDHVTAGLHEGWALREMKERVIDDTWLALKPKWERFRYHPISVVFAWRKST